MFSTKLCSLRIVKFIHSKRDEVINYNKNNDAEIKSGTIIIFVIFKLSFISFLFVDLIMIYLKKNRGKPADWQVKYSRIDFFCRNLEEFSHRSMDLIELKNFSMQITAAINKNWQL